LTAASLPKKTTPALSEAAGRARLLRGLDALDVQHADRRQQARLLEQRQQLRRVLLAQRRRFDTARSEPGRRQAAGPRAHLQRGMRGRGAARSARGRRTLCRRGLGRRAAALGSAYGARQGVQVCAAPRLSARCRQRLHAGHHPWQSRQSL